MTLHNGADLAAEVARLQAQNLKQGRALAAALTAPTVPQVAPFSAISERCVWDVCDGRPTALRWHKLGEQWLSVCAWHEVAP